MSSEITNSARKTKKRIFAIVAAVPARPAKPKIAARIAMTRNTSAQLNMVLYLLMFALLCYYTYKVSRNTLGIMRKIDDL